MEKHENISEYISYSKSKLSFIISLMILIIAITVDSHYNAELTDYSITQSLYLQQFSKTLTFPSFIFSYIIFFTLFLYIIIIYTLRENSENTFILLFGVTLMIYAQSLLKIVFKDPRPIFLNKMLHSDNCICDYGKPSGHALCSTGILFFIYNDLVIHHNFGSVKKFFLKIFFFCLLFLIMASRLFFGVHTINQCVLGFFFGITIFFFVIRMKDNLLKYIIWPIFYKERFRKKNPIAILFCIMILMNYLLFVVWADALTHYEIPNMKFIEFKNCEFCVFNEIQISNNFSSKSLKEALGFNLFFGMLLGIFLSKKKIFNYKGLFREKNLKKYFLRLFIFLKFASFLSFAYYPDYQGFMLFNIGKGLVIPLVVGLNLTSSYFWFLDFLGLGLFDEEKKFGENIDESFIIKG